ncbi:HtaA domain-containing protein [Leucobacter allii]|uniref:HtaA domain-containing protein n=1 Tax=Leucobacter allii TaxID=2932247 RepID=A0ABY4FIP8_9MICO|nr:HtaA domain-containing protein [Leucobacter allii]UOQ56430.1 HtaA domain-containing protein [Leucobacter allii]
MSARIPLLRAASTALAALLVIGGTLVGGAAAHAVVEDPAAQGSESAPAADPAAPAAETAPADESATAEEPATDETGSGDGSGSGSGSEPGTGSEPGADADGGDPAVGAAGEARGGAGSAADGTEDPAGAVADEAGATTELAVSDATLSWGVKSSFRNYIYNFAMFEGKSTLLGSATQVAQTKNEDGVFNWTGGTGSADIDGSAADVAFGEGNGVHFQSHPMDTDGDGENDAYSLDMTFTNPHVVVTSATTAELRLDVEGHEFVDMTSVGDPYSFDDVVVADLVLNAPTNAHGVLTWTNAAATLSTDGASAFGGFYEAGEALDPVTFSTGPMATAPGPGEPEPAEPVETSITVSAASAAVELGAAASLTATVAPSDAAGTVQFAADGAALGKPRKVSAGVATLSTAALTVGARAITATFAPADPAAFAPSTSEAITVTVTDPSAPVTSDVDRATASWGVKSSFRNYIYNFTMFEGDSKLLGKTTQKAQSKGADGVFGWSGGSGEVTTQTRNGQTAVTSADIGFRAGDGVHFQSHPMTVGDERVYALDMTFTKVRIKITSETTAQLILDANGTEFKSMTEVGAPYAYPGVVMADLALPAVTQSGSTYTWTNAAATLTAAGAKAFGGFYPAGEALDPITFSFNSDVKIDTKKPTKTTLAASAEKLEAGQPVTLTASTAPKAIGGTVAFSAGGKSLGTAAMVRGGAATKTVTLPVGIHSVMATFTPKDAAYSHSISAAVTVTVAGEGPAGTPNPGATGSSGQAAGSLQWGVSQAFVAYTTCANKEAYGYSHCAKGEISTSGVGSGYLFPQSDDAGWNRETQTGTVGFSGTVAFTGYGMTMFNVTNPTITVTGPTSATLNTGNSTSFGSGSYELDLGSAAKSVGPNGEVTWSGVPVRGSLSSGGAGGSGSQSIGLDPLTFTVGATSGVSYGSTQAGGETKKYTAADTAPTRTGLTVLTDREKIAAGGRIELAATGFEADDEGILVVLYDGDGRNPVVLDEDATASATGAVSWQGTLPKDISDEHVITFQGSENAGSVIDVLDGAKKSADQAKNARALSAAAVAERETAQAGILAPVAGMAVWEWWASAGGLVLIAACMTALAVRQRRALS